MCKSSFPVIKNGLSERQLYQLDDWDESSWLYSVHRTD